MVRCDTVQSTQVCDRFNFCSRETSRIEITDCTPYIILAVARQSFLKPARGRSFTVSSIHSYDQSVSAAKPGHARYKVDRSSQILEPREIELKESHHVKPFIRSS